MFRTSRVLWPPLVQRMLAQLVLALALLAIAAPAAAGADPAIEWTVPDRLGLDANRDGLIDYAGSAPEFERLEHGFPVDLRLREDLCEQGAAYTWRSAAGEVVEAGRKGCRVRQTFRREGSFPVTVQVQDPDGSSLVFSQDVTVQDWLIVSIGDSVGSGEGNPEAAGNFRRSVWQSPVCHRSSAAGTAGAALAIEEGDRETSTTFVHLACSGARIGVGLLGKYKGIDPADDSELPAQIDELRSIAAEREIDAVLVSIGANDVYFGSLVRFCLFHHDCIAKSFDPGDEGNPVIGKPGLPEVIAAALKRLPRAYAQLADELSEFVPPGRTLIVDYFDPTRDENGDYCRIGPRGFNISPDEARWAHTQLLEPLNREIERASRLAGWTEVTGVAEESATHGYCAPEAWVVKLKESFFSQKGSGVGSRLSGGLHPNRNGHRATAALIAGALAPQLDRDLAPHFAQRELVVTVEQPEDPPDSDSEAEAEDTALHVLAIALLAGLAILGGLVLFLRSRPLRSTEPLREAIEGGPPYGWLDAQSPEELEAYGEMVEHPATWVHRRVESLEFLSERVVRRRVSVDFTPPAVDGAVPPHAPIALLSKRLLARFDLRNEAGDSVPLQTREQNAAFSTWHMLAIAREVTGKELPEELTTLCWTIAQAEPPAARDAVVELTSQLEPAALREALVANNRFRTAIVSYAHNFPVIVAIEKPARRVMKYAYDDLVPGQPGLLKRLGLAAARVVVPVPDVGDAASRHFEFLEADGLDVFNAQLAGISPNGKFVASERKVEGDTAHLAVSNVDRGTRGVAGVSLRASRTGLLVGAPWLALLSAAALTAAWFALPQLAGEEAGSAASILLAAPAALSAFLGARRPHRLEAKLLQGARALVFISGTIGFLGAGALALVSSIDTLRVLLGTLAALSWLPVAGLILTWLLPWVPPTEDAGDVH